MNTQTELVAPVVRFSRAEWRSLRALRTRYHDDRDLFTGAERARLQFARWLVQAGKLGS